MTYSNARVIVLGASGFIGRWLARTIIPHNASTHLVVRNLASSKQLLSSYGSKGNITELDLTNFPALEKFFADVRPSIVFNLAGYGVDPAERDTHLAHEINGELPRRLCELLKAHHDPDWNGQHLIHTGTALEYGTLKGILSEDLTPRPITTYGISKMTGTNAVRKSEKRAIVVRLFNVYGPGEHEGRLLPSLLKTADSQEELALTPGTQKRDFTYVEDVAQGLIRLGLLPQKLKEPVNLATGELHTVREFAEIAARTLNIPLHLLHFGKLPFRTEELDHDGVSTARLNELVKWLPSTSIEQGVKKTIEFLESHEQ